MLFRNLISASNNVSSDPLASIFAVGRTAARIEPTSFTAFRSTTNLTPCNDGETCGFLLDTSKGVEYLDGSFTGLGSELITNGTFDSDVSGWTAAGGATVTWEAGRLKLVTTVSESGGSAYQALSVTAGKAILISGSVEATTDTALSSVVLRSGVSATTGFIENAVSQVGIGSSTGTIVYIPPTTGTIYIHLRSFDVETALFDNISVREVPGFLHLHQDNDNNRPVFYSSVDSTSIDDQSNILPDPTTWNNVVDSTITSGLPDSDGGNNAYSIKHDSSGGFTATSDNGNVSYTSGQTYSFYGKLRIITGQWIRVLVAGISIWLDTSTGYSVGTTGTGYVSSTATNIGGGWYEVQIQVVAQSTGTLNTGVQIQTGNGSSTELSGGEVYLYKGAVVQGLVSDFIASFDAGHLFFDGVNDFMEGQAITSSNVDVVTGISTTDSIYMIFDGSANDGNNNNYILTGQSSSSLSTHNDSGVPSVYVNQTQISDTRNTLYNSTKDGAVVLTVKDADFSDWQHFTVGRWAVNTSYMLKGRFFGVFVVENMSDNEISIAENYMAEKMDITL